MKNLIKPIQEKHAEKINWAKKYLANKYFVTISIFLVWIIFFDNTSWLVISDLDKEIHKYEEQRDYYKKEFEKNMAKKIRILAKTFYRIFKNDIFSSEIQNLTEEMEKIKITSSSGVVIAKTKTPIFQLFKQGLKLQKKAKARRKEMKKIFPSLATGFIDFQVIGSEGTVNIDNFRNNITLKDNKIMERPYPINFNIPTEDKVKNLDSLLKLISEMKKINFPSNKLRYIYDLKRNMNLEDFKKKIDFINILSKMSDDHIKFIKERFYLDYTNPNTFKNNFNNIFDILEIYDFIEEEEVEA